MTVETAKPPNTIDSWAINAYVNANIPIRPLKQNGDPDVSNLFTREEMDSVVGKLTENQLKNVFDNPTTRDGFHPLKLLSYQIPKEFWVPERIQRQVWNGVALQSGITNIPSRSDTDRVLLNILFDIDCNAEKNDNPAPKQIAERLIRELGLSGKTIIQNTPNGGLHVAVAVAVDPNDTATIGIWETRNISESEGINNCRVAIKIKGMQISLDPTHHRTKTHLQYSLVDKSALVIAECPEFYFKFIEELRKEGCLPEEDTDNKSSNYYKSLGRSSVGRFDFSPEEIENACSVILGSDNFNSIYVEGMTNETTLALAGYCYKRNASEATTKDLLARLVNLSGDNKLSKRYSTIRDTFKVGDTKGKDKIKGSTALIEQFKRAIKDHNNKSDADKQTLAEYRLTQLNDALNIKSKASLTKEQLEEMEDIRLASTKVTSADINFVLECMKKEAPFDLPSIKQLFYGMDTTFTAQPMPHIITSLTAGSGKNYLLELVANYFPQKYISPVTRISDKAIFHKNGVLVIPSINPDTGEEETTPLSEIIGGLVADKKEAEERLEEEKLKDKKERNRQTIKEITRKIYALDSEIKTFRGQAEKLIDVNKQIILCLDTPPESFLDMIMSLLSQDTVRDQRYEFAEKGATGQMGTRINRVRGTPNVFGTRVIDDTRSLRYEERNRRFVPVSPNVSAAKISKANEFGWFDDGMISEEFERETGVTSEQKARCRQIIASIVAKLNLHTKLLPPKKAGIHIPFVKSIVAAMPKPTEGEVWLMTIDRRLRRYLAIICKVNMDSRCRVFNTETKQVYPIPTYSDLKEAFELMLNAAANVRIYQATFFNQVFLPLYNNLGDSLPSEERKGYTLTEKVKGFTVNDLCEVIKTLPPPHGSTISPRDLQDKFLYPLVNSGVLSSVRSEINGRIKIFFPVQKKPIVTLFEDPDVLKLKITDENLWPSTNLIEEACATLLRYSQNGGGVRQKKYLLQDPDGKEISAVELTNKYLGNPEDCFIKAFEHKPKTPNIPKPEIDILSTSRNKYKMILIPQSFCGNIKSEIHNNHIEELSIEPISATVSAATTPTHTSTHTLNQALGKLVEPIPKQQTLDLPIPPSKEAQRSCSKVETELKSTIISEIQPFPTYLTEAVPELTNSGWFDLEWDEKNRIYCFCYLNCQGRIIKYHSTQFTSQKQFIDAILDVIKVSGTLIGFSIFNDDRNDFVSDLGKLKSNCEQEGLTEKHLKIVESVKFIDLQNVFGNTNIRNFLSKGDNVKYAGHWNVKLEDVSAAYINEHKTEGITGRNVQQKTPDQQLEYCMQDVVLTYKLTQKKNFELMGIIYKISEDIKLNFFDTCNAQYPTSWIGPKFKSIQLNKPTPELRKWIHENMSYDSKGKKDGVKYVGGYVKRPLMGIYIDAIHYDVVSMYPTMANIHNISPETVCCPHEWCKRNRLVPNEVMRIINDYVTDPTNKARKQEPRPQHYWICKERGKFANLMQYYFDKKIQYKRECKILDEKAVKIMANSSYGAFGSASFEYQDPRVAELITSFGQYTLRSLEEFVGQDNVLYADTDSLYFRKETPSVIEYAKNELQVTLEVAERWKILFLTNVAKNYFGMTEDGEVENTTLTGMKSNYPLIIREIAKKVVSKELLEQFITNPDTALASVLEYVRGGFKTLNETDPFELVITKLFQDDLWDHEINNEPIQLYKEILEDCNGDEKLAKSQSRGGEVYKYYKVKAKDRSVSRYVERYQLDMKTYRSYLFNAIKAQLEVYGINKNELKKLEKELVK